MLKMIKKKKYFPIHVMSSFSNMIVYYLFPHWNCILFTVHTGVHLFNDDYCYLKNSSVTCLSQPVQLPLKFTGHKHEQRGSTSVQGETKKYCSLILQIRT